MPNCFVEAPIGYVPFFVIDSNKTGKSTRLVIMASKSVSDVSHPSAWVPPKPEKQKITNPATSTNEV